MIKYPPFISIEGVDKAGKTTLINLLNKYQDLIHWTGKRIVFTREPGGFDNYKAEKLRTFILGNEFDTVTQTYLFAASRNEHVINTIRPNLSLGNIVITDRYIDSSFVYQGIVGNLGIESVKDINKYVNIGETIKMRVLESDDETFHVKLSIKDLDYRTNGNNSKIKETGTGFKILKDSLDEWINEKKRNE